MKYVQKNEPLLRVMGNCIIDSVKIKPWLIFTQVKNQKKTLLNKHT